MYDLLHELMQITYYSCITPQKVDFTHINTILNTIKEKSKSSFPNIVQSREKILEKYFSESGIPIISINGSLETDFEKMQKIYSLHSNSSNFSIPKSDMPKKTFSYIDATNKEGLSSCFDDMSDNLNSIVTQYLSNYRTSFPIFDFELQSRIREIVKPFNTSYFSLEEKYNRPEFVIPTLYMSNGISYYRDSNQKLLDFASIVKISQKKETSIEL